MKMDSRAKPAAIPDPLTIEEAIRKRAYELFETRDRESGHELDDWLQAEKEVLGAKSNAEAA
jgi:hypothetical protein